MPITYGPGAVFVAPAKTPTPSDVREVYDPDGPWELLAPRAPDVIPDELDGEDRD